MGHGWPTKQPYIYTKQSKQLQAIIHCGDDCSHHRKLVVLKVGDKGEVVVKVVKNFEWWYVKMGNGGQNSG
jgi:hypothetical protein